MGFQEALHPRVSGKFADKNAPTAAKKSGSERLSFDGKRGAGYGKKNGDARVRALQEALNRLGLTDSAGNKLVVDGKLGPKTTAAIKKAQRALGIDADGVVTPDFIAKLAKAKKLEKAKPVKKTKAVDTRTRKESAKKAAPAKKRPPVSINVSASKRAALIKKGT